jgi:hypothetical protein
VRRVGWDALRHYELLAAGTVPFFADLALLRAAPSSDDIGNNGTPAFVSRRQTMTSLPVDLLLEAMDLPGVHGVPRLTPTSPATDGGGGNDSAAFFVYKGRPGGFYGGMNVVVTRRPRVDWRAFNATRYYALADRLLAYTHRYLSTRSLAAYLLHRTGNAGARRVLLVHSVPYPDFMQNSVMHGLLDLGLDVTVLSNFSRYYSRPYDGLPASAEGVADIDRRRGRDLGTFHGGGYYYGLSFPRRIFTADERAVARDIASFDFVAFCGYRAQPLAELPLLPALLASAAMPPRERVAFVDGSDHVDLLSVHRVAAGRYGHHFVREQPDAVDTRDCTVRG